MLSIVALALCLAVPPAAAQPGWVKHPNATNSLFIQGVGIAQSTGNRDRDRQRADDLARAEIAKQIRVTVTARLTAKEAERGSTTRPTVTHDIEETVETSVSLTLDGVVIKDRWYHKKARTYYSLALLDRQAAAERVAEKLRVVAQRAATYIAQGDRDLAAGETYRGFLAYAQAADDRAGAEADEGLYRALVGDQVEALLDTEARSSAFSPTVMDIERTIGRLVSSLAFSPVAGDQQRIEEGRVPDRLTVRLTLAPSGAPVPAAGFPVRFLIAQGTGRLESPGVTARDGTVSATVSQAGTCGEAACVVMAVIDTAAVRAQAPGAQTGRWVERLGSLSGRLVLLPGTLGLEDGLGELACRLSRTLRPETAVVVDRFTYQDTRIAGPFTGPLRRSLNAALAGAGRVRLVERIDRSARFADFGDPNAAETIARAVRADAVIWGDYWERGDSVIVNARVTGTDGVRLASASVVIPRRTIPYDLRPPVIPDDLPPSAHGLPLVVWTDRGDGGLYAEGERLTVYVRAGADCRLRLFYRQADGHTLQIFPNRLKGDDRVAAGQVYTIPGPDDAFDLVVRPPFGVEQLIALASTTPFPRLDGREVSGGVLLSGTVRNTIQRLTTGARPDLFGQAAIRITTTGQ
ncbi:MAG: DUF4384 domain-containing protein [Candidatus Latescibacteria bacterium]|nr:DUF4384 domain-containing protein [Candidatus Latescibacterota bacterium]